MTDFEAFVQQIRPELHRYCARMTGSVFDGEDVVQDTLTKAFSLLPHTPHVDNMRGWLFRIAHNKAIDHLRTHARRFTEPLDEHPEIAAETPPLSYQEMTSLHLALFMKLTPVQRASLILKDVLGYSLSETAAILDASLASIKGALHRGRASLSRLARHQDPLAPSLDAAEMAQLQTYVRHFQAGEFDRLRELLSQHVHLDVVGITKEDGANQVGGYFHRYARLSGLRVQIGVVEGRAAVVVHASQDRPSYPILIDWLEGKITSIRDYRYVPTCWRAQIPQTRILCLEPASLQAANRSVQNLKRSAPAIQSDRPVGGKNHVHSRLSLRPLPAGGRRFLALE